MLHSQTSTKSSSLSPRLSSSLPHLQHKHEQTREQKENQWRALIRRGSAPAPLPLFLFFTRGVAPASERRRQPSDVLEVIQLTPPRLFHRSGGRKTNGGGQIKRQGTQTHLMKKNCQPKNTLQGRSAETRRVPADGHAALPDITVWVKGVGEKNRTISAFHCANPCISSAAR